MMARPRRRSIVLLAAAVLSASCDNIKSAVPLSPGAPAAGIEINGPGTVAPGQVAQFGVNAVMSDGTRKAT